MEEQDRKVLIDKIEGELDVLAGDMEEFARVYEEDPTCWQGEAAKEEACYITADIGEFREQTAKIREELGMMREAK